MRLEVQPNIPTPLFVEDWAKELGDKWLSFGEPRPEVITTSEPGSGRAFWNAGDGRFVSGAVLLTPFDGSHGLALRTQLSTPVTAHQWQILEAAFILTLNRRALLQWDRSTGYLWGEGRLGISALLCGFKYPGLDEGPFGRDSIRLPGLRTGPIAAPDIVRTARWYELVVQLFPDGRCGIAINGRPVGVTEQHGWSMDSAYLSFFGNSRGTRLLVGRVEVFRGVLPEIPWPFLPGRNAR
jgi:hypothetical protein